MEKIDNYNCKELCIEKTCSKKYTKFTTKEINGLKVVLCFCDEHAEQFESTRKTIILGYEIGFGTDENQKIPVILCEKRKDIDFGMVFYCEYCKKHHSHGKGEGHRMAHCSFDNPKSPFKETGYILTLNKDYLKNKKKDIN